MMLLRICYFFFVLLFIDGITIVTCREPSNITRASGATSVFIPCPFEFQSAPPIWRINGVDYTSSTLPSIFSLDPGGIFISEVHPCLNGYSFQCIDISGPGLAGQRSQIGFLTVIPLEGLRCQDFQLFAQNIIRSNDSMIELNHEKVKYGTTNTTLAWEVFNNISTSDCNTSRVVSNPPCRPSDVFMDVNTTGDTEIIVQAQRSEMLLDFHISSLRLNPSDQRPQCPYLHDAVRFNATETKSLNLLLGKNNCTSINIKCEGGLHIAISNPDPQKRDIICPVNPEMKSVCFISDNCALLTSMQNTPTLNFSVCEATSISSECTVRFEDNCDSPHLNNTRVDFYELRNTPILCGLEQLPPTRVYFDSYAINVVAGIARASVDRNTGTVCFFSLVENCTSTDLTQYNVSVTDDTKHVIYTNMNISESSCITIEEVTQPRCAPYSLSVDPFTVDDDIIYDSFTQEVTHDAANMDLCQCITQNVEFELVQDNNNSEVDYSCSSRYISSTDIVLRLDSVNYKKKCANGSVPLSMDVYASCDGSTTTIDVCGYLMLPNGTTLFECPLSTCVQILCPTNDPTRAPSNTTEIILGVVIPLLIIAIAIVIGASVTIVIVRKIRQHLQVPNQEHQVEDVPREPNQEHQEDDL